LTAIRDKVASRVGVGNGAHAVPCPRGEQRNALVLYFFGL